MEENKVNISDSKGIEAEPKRNFRFIVRFPEDFEIEEYLVQKVNRPKFVDYKWENIEIEFIDLIAPSTSQALVKIIDFCQRHKLLESKVLFEFRILSLDPTGAIVEKWNIKVEELLKVDFGDCSYGDDKIQMCKVLLKPYSCTLSGE